MTDQEGYKAVNYVGLIPVLTEGIKDQQKEITKLQKTAVSQEKEIDDLKLRLAKIEALLEGNK